MEYKAVHVMFLSFFMCSVFKEAILIGNYHTEVPEQSLEKASSQYDCDQTIRSQYGWIRSPGHPGNYPRYTRCEYVVEKSSPNCCELKLSFEWFDVARMYFSNCSTDFFEIQNGEQRQKLCGELPSGTKKFVYFPENSNILVFRFQSTFHQKRGFSIQIKQLPYSCKRTTTKQPTSSVTQAARRAPPPTPSPPSCNQVISGRIGRITFQEEKDAPARTCTYSIRKSEPRACIVQLDFSSFEVSRSADCASDFLLIPSERKLCGTLGGSRKILQYAPSQEELVLTFSSSRGSSNSFDIQVSQLPGPCDSSFRSNVTGSYDPSTSLSTELNVLNAELYSHADNAVEDSNTLKA